MKKTIIFLFIITLIASCASHKLSKTSSFSKSQIKMVMNAESTKPMRVFKINNKKDSILLRKKSAYVKPDTTDVVLKRFVDRMYVTVRDSMSMGVGIAAPQVGILKNIIWVQRFDKEDAPFEVYLNPKINTYSEEKLTRKEGCLSVPNRTEVLNNRSKIIEIEYDTMEGKHKIETVSDFTSIIFQHEIDHLNGIIYLDHLNKEVRDAN